MKLSSLAITAVVVAVTSPSFAAVLVGESALIGTLHYSDTFSVNSAAVENTYDNPAQNWSPKQFSPPLANNGLAGSGTFVETDAARFSLAYGITGPVVAQADVVLPNDRLNISFSPASATGNNLTDGLFVFMRQTTHATQIGLFNSGIGETNTGLSTGITGGVGTNNSNWNNVAVAYTPDTQVLEFFINQASVGSVNLTTFASGVYAGVISTDRIGFGGTGLAYYDNVQVGVQVSEIIPEPASLALLAAGGLMMLARRRNG